jgi:hypothetical protein
MEIALARALPNGDVNAHEGLQFTASAYQLFKQAYPTLSELTRLFNPALSSMQYVNLQVNEYDSNNIVVATYTLARARKCRKPWQPLEPAASRPRNAAGHHDGDALRTNG